MSPIGEANMITPLRTFPTGAPVIFNSEPVSVLRDTAAVGDNGSDHYPPVVRIHLKRCFLCPDRFDGPTDLCDKCADACVEDGKRFECRQVVAK
jgi:hypothetical protein